MACGTPVLASRCGSVPEIIEDGLTGRIVSDVGEAVHAVPELLALDRKKIRARFEERFSAAPMANNYVKIYQQMLHKQAAAQRKIAAVVAHGTEANSIEARLAAARRDN